MATIKDIIDEIKTIANAQLAIATFAYWDVDIPNSERNHDYPALFVNRDVPAIAVDAVSRNITYRISFVFGDLFHRANEVNENVNQDAQMALENIFFNFRDEFISRSVNWELQSIPLFNYQFKQYNDRLNVLNVSMDIDLIVDCEPSTTPLFNYDC